jgi:hypothetical protein
MNRELIFIPYLFLSLLYDSTALLPSHYRLAG